MRIEKMAVIITLVILAGVFAHVVTEMVPYNESSSDYYIVNTYSETGSKNLLTGIYLNYRLFDSVFEASILFVVTAGILFMGKKDEEIR